MRSILILLHCESNTGYAIEPLELTFFAMAEALVDGDRSRIHFGYPSMKRGLPRALPSGFDQCHVVNAATASRAHCREIEQFVRDREIDVVFGFDQPVSRLSYRFFRRGGVRHFVSYWGAPMSSMFGPIRRTLKRIEVSLRRNGPDHYIFESQGMADFAVLGRGISRRRTSVVYTGIDTDHWRPDDADREYVYRELHVPRHRRIFFYSGHMEERKGVPLLMRAANRLAASRHKDDWHLLLLGNKDGQEQRYLDSLVPEARNHVLFAGYRTDLHRLQRGCYAGVIASTGWDSLPRSGLEMLASGLPVIVSNLPGIREVVEQDRSGLVVPVIDESALTHAMARILDDAALRDRLSAGARQRAVDAFSHSTQLSNLIRVVRSTTTQ